MDTSENNSTNYFENISSKMLLAVISVKTCKLII